MNLRVLLAVTTLVFPSAAVARAQSSAGSQTATFQVAHKTEAPGVTLSPGSYTIRVADHLNDRFIVQIQKNGGGPENLLAYPNPSLSGNGSGTILFPSGLKNKPTLRGYAFPGGPVIEFVYPKKDAVTLAKSNNVQVMAIDPASENRPKLPQLTQTDMDEVTLWMLTPTPVQPGAPGPGIQAARYQAPAPTASAPARTEARNTPPPPPPAPVAPAAQSAAPTPSASSYNTSTPPAPVQVASNERPHFRPNVKQLPHTASNLPLVELGGLFSLLLAGSLGLRRWSGANQA